MIALELFALFAVKHFVADFVVQTKYQYSNKGTYGHPGGLLHVAIHAIMSLVILFAYFPSAGQAVLGATAVEIFLHYHIDWLKMNINRYMNWACNTHEQFWVLTGFDQLLHYLTYIWMLCFMLGRH